MCVEAEIKGAWSGGLFRKEQRVFNAGERIPEWPASKGSGLRPTRKRKIHMASPSSRMLKKVELRTSSSEDEGLSAAPAPAAGLANAAVLKLQG